MRRSSCGSTTCFTQPRAGLGSGMAWRAAMRIRSPVHPAAAQVARTAFGPKCLSSKPWSREKPPVANTTPPFARTL